MYHPSRGGVRGGRDQFNWDDVKADKHRENYIGHSVKAPVGRWQKGKDLTWYANDKKGDEGAAEALKAEIKKIKEEEEQAMRELLGLAPKREKKFLGSRLDKQETAELFKRGKAEEELAPGYAQGERVQGLGFAPAPRHAASKNVSTGQLSIFENTPKDHSMEPADSHLSKENFQKDDDAGVYGRQNNSKEHDAKERRKEKKEEKRAKRHKSDENESRHHKKQLREH